MIREQYGVGENDEDDDSEYDDDDDDEDCERVSPLDAYNEFAIMKETLSTLGASALMNWFSQADLVSWNQILDENIAKDAQDSAKAKAG
jgi:hypothetical protein